MVEKSTEEGCQKEENDVAELLIILGNYHDRVVRYGFANIFPNSPDRFFLFLLGLCEKNNRLIKLELLLFIAQLLLLLLGPIISEDELALVVQDGVKERGGELREVQDGQDGGEMIRGLIDHLSVLDDDVGGCRPKGNNKIANFKEYILQLLYLCRTNLNAQKFFLLDREVVVDLGENLLLKL